MTLSETCLKYFSDLEDPRLHNHNLRHNFHDILIIAILATICGADGWVDIEQFGVAKQKWLSTFLELPHGIPSHDTFGRVFSLIDPEAFGACFLNWIHSLPIDLKKEIIALDGKSVRGSNNRQTQSPMLHLVSAWAANNRMMLAQVKTEDHSNEITAIPKLLKLIDVKDSVVTIDAMGCQSKIARQITSQGADYVLSLKENQKTLYDNIKSIFLQAEVNKSKQYKKILHCRKIEKDKKHGRIEKRTYTLVSARDPVFFALRWPGLKGIGKVDIVRTVNKEVQRSTRYFITTLEYEQIDVFMQAVRKHWQIEIDLHWSLDVCFREDHSQVRIGHAAENLALIRRIALNLLKQEKTHKRGVACRRKSAGWDHQYLLKVLVADQGLFDKEAML